MSEVTQDVWIERLYLRTSRLRRLVALEAPESVLLGERHLVMKAIMELEPVNLSKALDNLSAGMALADKERDAIEDTGRERREKMT